MENFVHFIQRENIANQKRLAETKDVTMRGVLLSCWQKSRPSM